MPSFADLAARCERMGGELCERDLSLHELIDRATALTLVGQTLEELIERKYPVVASGMSVDPVQQDIDAARAALHDAAAAAQAGHREEIRDRLLRAQQHLLAACQILIA